MENIGLLTSLIAFSLFVASTSLFLCFKFDIFNSSNKYSYYSWTTFNYIAVIFFMVANLSFFNPFLFLLEFENKLQCLLYYSFFLTISLSIITLISYIKIEKFKDLERIKFFSDLQSSDLPTNAMVSDDDMSLIKNRILEQIALSKKQFDVKKYIPFQINSVSFILHITMDFESYLKVQSTKKEAAGANHYECCGFFESFLMNEIVGIEFENETNDFNLWALMDALQYSSLSEINQDSVKLYEMIKI